jgi:hypothetical protein
MCVGSDLGHRPSSLEKFLLSPIHPLPPPPVWSHSPIIQLISEPVWSLVGFNRLCNLKVTWRKVQSSWWFSMVRILVTGKTELTTIS